MSTINDKIQAISILKEYTGKNPFILAIKKDVCVKNSSNALTDLAVEYVLKNHGLEPKQINKAIKITDWYGEKLKQQFQLDFTPQIISIKVYMGETKFCYHCYVKYRQNMMPISLFIPKKALFSNFLVEDFHNYQVNFERYDNLSMKKDPNRRLKEHQKEAVQFLLSRKKCILAHDQGMGKSATLSVAAVEGNFDSIIVICPASLKTNWRDELMWYVPERDITIIDSINDKTKTELEAFLGYGIGKSGKTTKELQEEAKTHGKWSENRFIIINFDILDEFYKIPESRSSENIAKALENSPMLQYIMDKKSLIIVDESHKLSNSTSGRYKIVKDLIKRGKPDSIYLSTGTPITNNPQNFYNLLQLIGDPIADDWNYYMERYCGAIKIPRDGKEKAKRAEISNKYITSHGVSNWYMLSEEQKQELNSIIDRNCKMMLIYKDATNTEELKERVAHVYLRRTKEDLKGLPEKHIHEIIYNFNQEQKNEYKRLWDEYEAAKLETNPDAELNKELIEGGIYRRYCSNQMVPNTIELADKFIKFNEKVVIACCYDDELYALRDYYKDSCVIYNGKMSLKEKDEAKNKFINDENIKVFITNITAGGVGITLVVSHIMIFNNFQYTYAECAQMMDRIHRIGQTKDCEVYFQMFKGTQYEKMWEIVLKKQLISDAIIKKEDEK